jgi:hypothetical protein
MSYLDIAKTVVTEYEKNERNEKTPAGEDPVAIVPPSLTDPDRSQPAPVSLESPQKGSRQLTAVEAVALGLNPDLIWMRVSREEVAASRPPGDWDRILPDACAWRSLCHVLGPCPRHQDGEPCRTNGDAP